MNNVFVDTSALYAFLDRHDEFHQAAERAFSRLEPSSTMLTTSSYVILETVTLLQNRIGLEAVRRWRSVVQPILNIIWVDADLHERALTALTATEQRTISLTDWTSFEVMRQHGIEDVFTFDSHFAQQGFNVVPKTDRSRRP